MVFKIIVVVLGVIAAKIIWDVHDILKIEIKKKKQLKMEK
jgi:hypothetical protein